MKLKKRAFPSFGELNLRIDVAKALTCYEELSKQPVNQFLHHVETRSYIAKSFPTEEGGYRYLPVTEFVQEDTLTRDDVEIVRNETGRSQFRRGFNVDSREYTPEMDERLYSQVPHFCPPYLREFLASFKGQIGRTRFAFLQAGRTIDEHVDNNLDHSVRIHIPLITDEQCIFGVKRDGQWTMQHLPSDGRCFFVNTAFPHKVEHRGTADRLHLIVNLNSQEDIQHLAYKV